MRRRDEDVGPDDGEVLAGDDELGIADVVGVDVVDVFAVVVVVVVVLAVAVLAAAAEGHNHPSHPLLWVLSPACFCSSSPSPPRLFHGAHCSA